VQENYLGITSGILATARNLGMVTGATLAAALFSWWYSFLSGGMRLGEYTAVDGDSFLMALRVTFILTACLAFSGSFLSAGRR
jgi:urease accessory protein UreF